ncbi:MAG: hypothetical protein ACYC27_01655 [Armatimonadota bacterium]
MDTVSIENTEVKEAIRYIEDQAYTALLAYREPVRSGEISGAIGNDKYSAKLVRHVLAASSRFAKIDRRWDIEVRYEDKQRTVERVLNEIIAMYGHPMTIPQIALEISSVYERPADYYEPMLQRILADEERYFVTANNQYGLRSWLLEITSDAADEILFDNGIDAEYIQSLEDQAAKVDWTSGCNANIIIDFINNVGNPVDNNALGFFYWRAIGDGFDPIEAFDALFQNDGLIWLSDIKWATKDIINKYDEMLADLADRLVEEIEEAAPASVENAAVEEDIAPTLSLTISERDLDEVSQIVSSKGGGRLPEILENIFEISPRDPVYTVAAEGLSDAMRADPRFIWLGTDRWAMANTIPAYVKEMPEELTIPTFNFETPEGERIDVELDDEGLEGALATEIHNLLVQDVKDCDSITEQEKLPASDFAKCVITKHHKELGTFPLCQIPRKFFPMGPAVIQLTFTSGTKHEDMWLNRETGIIYNMDSWYTDEMPESGAVFELAKTGRQDEYTFTYNNDTDPLAFVGPGRIEDLMALAEEAKEQNLTTYDVMCKIMQDHRKGTPFVTLFTEVNIVRRTTRRLVASILSSYYAFYQRPKSALWQFDEKKENQGFKKAKRKYIRK